MENAADLKKELEEERKRRRALEEELKALRAAQEARENESEEENESFVDVIFDMATGQR